MVLVVTMRVAAALMMLGTAFAVATPAAEADPQNLGVIVSELPALVSELPAALSALGPQLPGELSAFIQQYGKLHPRGGLYIP